VLAMGVDSALALLVLVEKDDAVVLGEVEEEGLGVSVGVGAPDSEVEEEGVEVLESAGEALAESVPALLALTRALEDTCALSVSVAVEAGLLDMEEETEGERVSAGVPLLLRVRAGEREVEGEEVGLLLAGAVASAVADRAGEREPEGETDCEVLRLGVAQSVAVALALAGALAVAGALRVRRDVGDTRGEALPLGLRVEEEERLGEREGAALAVFGALGVPVTLLVRVPLMAAVALRWGE